MEDLALCNVQVKIRPARTSAASAMPRAKYLKYLQFLFSAGALKQINAYFLSRVAPLLSDS